ncbi:MAG: hypothetical protein HYU64_04735 [Armatimonadetes bacterium]|nr:hypothetical protein [Armatimonadota bacterium]
MKIPKFQSEKEEIEFWETHSLSDYLDDTEDVAEAIELSDALRKRILARGQKKRLLTLRLDEDLIDRTKKVARKKAIGYQTLMRLWIAEGLNKETRH